MRAVATFVAIASLALITGRVQAAPNVVHLSWGSQLNPSDCPNDENYRELAVNVTQQVTNDADRAPAGNYWARLEYNRHIQVWKVGDTGAGEAFCVLVKYQGAWTTIQGASPGNQSLTIPAGIEGTFQGGYRVLIVGTINQTGNVRLRGRIPAADRQSSGLPFVSPAPDDWIDQYFSSVNSIMPPAWWGWVYHGGPNSTFVHACSGGGECPGNSGNITD